MALLSETNPRPGKCRDCHRPAVLGQERCQSHMAQFRLVQAQLDAERISCPHCGTLHHGIYGRKFCSKRCAYTYHVEDAMAFVEAARTQLDLGAATGILHRLFQYLRDRDGNRCALCRKTVDLDRKDMQGPSVDHVIPRSKGGTHDLANLTLAHRSCNTRKGNRTVEGGEQLRLIG